jgi:hypothetical protein
MDNIMEILNNSDGIDSINSNYLKSLCERLELNPQIYNDKIFVDLKQSIKTLQLNKVVNDKHIWTSAKKISDAQFIELSELFHYIALLNDDNYAILKITNRFYKDNICDMEKTMMSLSFTNNMLNDEIKKVSNLLKEINFLRDLGFSNNPFESESNLLISNGTESIKKNNNHQNCYKCSKCSKCSKTIYNIKPQKSSQTIDVDEHEKINFNAKKNMVETKIPFIKKTGGSDFVKRVDIWNYYKHFQPKNEQLRQQYFYDQLDEELGKDNLIIQSGYAGYVGYKMEL